MSNTPSSSTAPKSIWFFRVWMAALAVFLLWSGWFLYTSSPIGEPAGRSVAGNTASAANGKTPPAMAEDTAASMVEDRGTVLEGLPKWNKQAPALMPFNATMQYVLVGAGLQGFYQNADGAGVWTLSSPEPQIHAQLIKRGPDFPQVVTTGVTLSWELEAQAGLAGSSSKRQGEMAAVDDSYFTARIPVSAVAAGGLNPYPLVTIRAEDEQGNLLAETAAVLAVAPGYGCAYCHENAGTAILEVHDRHSGTSLAALNGQGSVIDCRSCHTGLKEESAAENAASEGGNGEIASGNGGTGTGNGNNEAAPGNESAASEKGTGERSAGGMSVSAAVHGWHAAYLSGRGADACMTCHIALGTVKDADKSEVKPLFVRDFHADRGLNCTRCHGFVEDHALALLKAEQEGGNPDASGAMASLAPRAVELEEIAPRLPWKQEPDCTGCHDFMEKPDLVTASAFNKWSELDGAGAGLFSARRDDMLMARCITCHGAPHAVYAARNPIVQDLDNLPPLQYQEQAAPLGSYGNCALCHGEPRDYSAHHPLVERTYTEVHIPTGASRAMPPALFSHNAHVKQVACIACHHKGHEDGKSILCASSGCHDGVNATRPAKKGEEVQEDPRYFYNAFHGPFPGCMACHTQSLQAGKPAGPTDCKACHQAPSSRWDGEKGK